MSTNDAIQVEASPESAVVHRLEVEVSPKRVSRAFERAYRDLAKRVSVKGFRAGKAPRSVLERLYGGSVAEQLEQALVAETLADAVEQTDLVPVAEPTVEASPPSPDAPFRYVARIEVKPEIALPDLAGLPARRPRVEVGEEDVIGELEALRQRHAQVVEEAEGTPLREGLVANIDFVGRIDGEPFEGGTGRGVDVELGAGRFLPEFETQLVGARAGEDREITVDFPDDYGNAELAGKQAVFAAHVASVKRREVPEADDEFAKDLGEFDSLAALRERIRQDLTTSRERASRQVFHRSLVDALIERTEFEVPPGLVERELQRELRVAHERLHGQVPEEALHDQLGRWREEWRPRAERSVRESLLLEAVARAEGLEVAEADVEARIEEMAAEQGASAARLRKAWGGEDLDRALSAQLADEKALEFLAARAKVEETDT